MSLKTVYLICLLNLVAILSYSQQKVANDSLKQLLKFKEIQNKIAALDTLLKPSHDTYNLGTPKANSEMIQSKFRSFTGSDIKNGKSLGSSAVIDAKSATVNISLKPWKNSEFYLVPSLAGASNNGFVSVFTGDRYSRTITGGFNFILPLGKQWLFYKLSDQQTLHNDLRILQYDYKNRVTKKIESSF